VEGAELSLLGVAEGLLCGRLRSILLVELNDLRTTAWRYGASQIVTYPPDRRYRCPEPCERGWLSPALLGRYSYKQNLIAVPEERIEQLETCIERAQNERPGT
jgi:hypothetical protein